MEAVGELPLPTILDNTKVNVASNEASQSLVENELCHKSNGVVESVVAGFPTSADVAGPQSTDLQVQDDPAPSGDNVCLASEAESIPIPSTDASLTSEVVTEQVVVMETTAAVEHLLEDKHTLESNDIVPTSDGHVDAGISDDKIIDGTQNDVIEEMVVDSIHTSNDNVTLKTEIVVEKNENYVSLGAAISIEDDADHANNILNEIGQNIELSDVLQCSDVVDNGENNNSGRQEVFNKEELLDILEGNDVGLNNTDKKIIQKQLESELAMQQLSRLKSTKMCKKKKIVETHKSPRKKRGEKRSLLNCSIPKNSSLDESNMEQDSNVEKVEGSKKSETIVNELVQDWDDDELIESDQPSEIVEDTENQQNHSDNIQNELKTPSVDSASQEPCKSSDEGQPQRRLGRVIKKKVIFDPDNPDTFTKGKVVSRKDSQSDKDQLTRAKVVSRKDSQSEKDQQLTKGKVVSRKDIQLEKEHQTPNKKCKTEHTPQRAQSKSPVSKMSWKKPTPKSNSKQNKRLTEVDKLLMDEGAVNMIYQLTPEAPMGRGRNMKTKAEFIKKIQSSTPDGKEMKFRERKKEVIRAEEEAKKILSGKHRSSLSSSVKSPSVCEDFEAHSADDSIIYRRHSSSSYSSSCMSPRRLSDVDAAAAVRAAQLASDKQPEPESLVKDEPGNDVFMADTSGTEMINKTDCLSIKEKLNSKLSLALKKKKRDTTKNDNNKINKKSTKIISKDIKYKYLAITIKPRIAEICIYESDKMNIELIKELGQALDHVDTCSDISITVLLSQSGKLCSDLDLADLIEEDIQKRTNIAYEVAESIRLLFKKVDSHSKLLVSGVWGECSGIELVLVALSDVAFASENATFSLGCPLLPGISTILQRCPQLPRALINELVVFEHRLNATEALRGGLLTRTLWPGKVNDQVRAMVQDIATKPPQSILLKKQLLNSRKCSESESFLLSLEKERDLLVQYWTSVEGQEALRSTFKA